MVNVPTKGLMLVTLCLLLTGCPQFFDALLNSEAPQGVSASTGEGRSVSLHWSEPNLSEEDEREVDSYDVFRDGVFIGTSSWEGYEDDEALPATRYSYSVSANFDDGSVSPESSSSSGWYVPSTTLRLDTASGGAYTQPGTAKTTDGWVQTMVVKGWTYHFEVSSATEVWFCDDDRPWRQSSLGTSSSLTWKSDRTGTVWLKIKSARRLRGWYE